MERVGKEEVLVVWCGAIRSSRRAVPAEIGPSTSNYTQTPFTMITRTYYVQLDMHTSSNGAEYALARPYVNPEGVVFVAVVLLLSIFPVLVHNYTA